MRLRVGLVGRSPVWEEVLLHEGVEHAHALISDLEDASQFSVVVVCKQPDHDERSAIERYLKKGGSILSYAPHLDQIAGKPSRKEEIQYVVGEGDAFFPDTQLIDVGRSGAIPYEARYLRAPNGTFSTFVGEFRGGYAILLPFDPAEILCDFRAVSKNFYASLDRLPSERVSLTGKGEVRHLLHRCIEVLHHMRGLPYIHLWYYPGDERSVFAYRIDTDSGSPQEVDTLYTLAKENGVALTWFVDVKSQETWLHHFAGMVGQEIGIHCYEHHTYADYPSNLKNIQRAKRELNGVGVHPSGFAAPFGHWNTELAKAVEESGIAYTSEFSFMYDALPFHPVLAGRRFSAMQVPVHPICIGSLKRVGYSEQRMMEYFAMVTHQKLRRNEPLFYYHHPTHRAWDVVEHTFGLAEHHRIRNTTFGDFARWWTERNTIKPVFAFSSNELLVNVPGEVKEDFWLHLTTPENMETWTPFIRSLSLRSLKWHERVFAPPPADVRRVREFDPRNMLGDLYTTLARKFR